MRLSRIIYPPCRLSACTVFWFLHHIFKGAKPNEQQHQVSESAETHDRRRCRLHQIGTVACRPPEARYLRVFSCDIIHEAFVFKIYVFHEAWFLFFFCSCLVLLNVHILRHGTCRFATKNFVGILSHQVSVFATLVLL